ncbi:peptidase family M48-domain-containing protein [Suillus lakei]|nr:peptidase family M48-domain-containing protein [Suillus lakei]
MFRPALKVTSRVSPVSSMSWRFPRAGVQAATVVAARSSSYRVLHSTPKSSGLVLVQVNLCRRRQIWHAQRGVAPFHSSGPNQGLPLIPMLLGAFKASTTIEVVRTAARVALTFLPLILFKNRWSKKYLKHHEKFHPGEPVNEEKKAELLKRIRARTVLFNVLLFVPVALFWLAILASAEQTPITGRWRLIILSPEEEDEIAAQLKGPNWYHTVIEILSTDGPPKLIPTTDWRYQWVRDTLRRLEAGIPVLQREQELASHWLDTTPDQPPLPPPAEYPLRPRPRAMDAMRRWSETLCGRSSPHSAHVIAGPPYSLLIVDKPDAANAFSYGFGPDGACGVVVYSGFIDNIISKALSSAMSSGHTSQTLPEKTSWWTHLFGSLVISPLSPLPPHPVPTEQQTAELAILLAHEVAHLVLSHHLETLSSATIMVPALISMFADVTRTLLFPVTMLFGPFVNDAVAQLGKVGSGELTKIGEYCTSVHQEIEADVVSARILAHAGFDAREAVTFWEEKQSAPQAAECSLTGRPGSSNSSWPLARQIMGSSHPVNEVRIEKLKSELVRWELEKRVAEKKRIMGEPERSSILGLV